MILTTDMKVFLKYYSEKSVYWCKNIVHKNKRNRREIRNKQANYVCLSLTKETLKYNRAY